MCQVQPLLNQNKCKSSKIFNLVTIFQESGPCMTSNSYKYSSPKQINEFFPVNMAIYRVYFVKSEPPECQIGTPGISVLEALYLQNGRP